MYACPHCGEPGIGLVRKMFLGPVVSATCRSCRRKVGVPWWSVVWMVPFFVALPLVWPSLQEETARVAFFAYGITMTSLGWHTLPLVKRSA